MENKDDAPCLRNNLLDELQPLGAGRELEGSKSGNIAAWMRQTRNKALSDWIADNQKHDWYGAGYIPNCGQRHCAVGDDHVRLFTD